MSDTPLPPSFDLFLDAKSYSDLEAQYRQACETKSTIEQLCRDHNVSLPSQPDAKAQAREAWRIAGMVTNNDEALAVHKAICELFCLPFNPTDAPDVAELVEALRWIESHAAIAQRNNIQRIAGDALAKTGRLQ